MLESLLITFREGIEAFLIIAISLTYLKRTNRQHLTPAIYWGIGGAVVTSSILGLVLQSIADNPLTEGLLALVAGVLVFSLTFHMVRAGKRMKNAITDTLESSAQKGGFTAMLGIFLFTVLMISREGMETVLMMSALTYQVNSTMLIVGAIAGVSLAAIIGYLWVSQSHHINLGRFMQVTSVFLMLFSVQLFLYGLHELSEVQALPVVDNFTIHTYTESFAHDSVAAQFLSYGLLAVPLLWLAGSYMLSRLRQNSAANVSTNATA